jgi:anion-transporting  ArsA/GET3 family ATPase
VFRERLIVVSGKGGVGKTVIASAIADLCARQGNTVLVSFDGQTERHPLFDVPLTYEPQEAAHNLSVMRVDAFAAIREYVRRKVPFSGMYDAFLKSRMFRDFAEAAPGFEELMCLGKLYDLATDSEFSRVVFDAPATGHFKTLVDVPAATLQAVLVGPLNHNARKIQDLLMNPERTRVVLATLAEEMAAREVLELEAFVHERRMGVGPMIVNQRVPSRFSPDEIEAMRSLSDSGPALMAAIEAASAESDLAASQADSMALLQAQPRDLWQLPRIVDHEPAALLDGLVGHLAEQADSG